MSRAKYEKDDPQPVEVETFLKELGDPDDYESEYRAERRRERKLEVDAKAGRAARRRSSKIRKLNADAATRTEGDKTPAATRAERRKRVKMKQARTTIARLRGAEIRRRVAQVLAARKAMFNETIEVLDEEGQPEKRYDENDRPIDPLKVDFATLGLSMLDKRVPKEALEYLLSRGHTRKSIKLNNFRFFEGLLAERYFPASRRGRFSPKPNKYEKTVELDFATSACFLPLWAIVLPYPDDKSYAVARIHYKIISLGDGGEPPKFLTPSDRAIIPFVPRGAKVADLLDSDKRFYLVESPFKAAVASAYGINCIGVNGCFGTHTPGTVLTKNATSILAAATIRPEIHPYLLKNREVSFLTDADVRTNLNVAKAQLDFMDAAAIGFECRTLYTEIPDLGGGKSGIDDFLATGKTRRHFEMLPTHGRESMAVNLLRCAFMDLNELGLKDRFVALHAENHRHDPNTKEWVSYSDSTGYIAAGVGPHRAMELIVKSTLPLELAAAKSIQDRKNRQRFQNECAKEATMKHALSLAAKDVALEINSASFDADSDLLGMKNGILRLSTGKLLPFSRDHKVTKACGCVFDENAIAVEFVKFMRTLVNGDEDLLRHLQEVLGAALLGRSIRTTIHVFYGPGSTGKTTLIEIMVALLGEYALASKADLLLKNYGNKDAEKPTPFLKVLRGRRLVVCSELNADTAFDDALIKDLTGGDTITARGLNEAPITFKNTATIWIRGNHLPRIGTDSAIRDRVSVSPFLNVIKDRDKDLGARIIAKELAGVLNWVLVGMRRYVARGCEFKQPEAVANVTRRMQEHSDVIGLWLEECYNVDMTKIDDPWRTEWKAVYKSYKDWCEANGHRPHSNKSTAKLLRERFGMSDEDDEKWPLKSNGFRWATGFREIVIGPSRSLIEREMESNDRLMDENSRLLDDNDRLRSRVEGRSSSPLTGSSQRDRSARFSARVVPIERGRRKR